MQGTLVWLWLNSLEGRHRVPFRRLLLWTALLDASFLSAVSLGLRVPAARRALMLVRAVTRRRRRCLPLVHTNVNYRVAASLLGRFLDFHLLVVLAESL